MGRVQMWRGVTRGAGLPCALGILYMHGGRANGWAIGGLSFPGHCLLRLDLGAERSISDPFNGGQPRDAVALRALLKGMAGENAELRPEHTRPVGCRDVLLRLQNNIKLRYVQEERSVDALAILETMLMIAPEQIGRAHV